MVSQQVWKFVNDGSDQIYKDLRQFFVEKHQSWWCGHNVTSFDGPVLGRLCGFDWPFERTVDTLVLSYLYNPALEEGHSLESYGKRLKFPKGQHDDWSKLTPEMLTYCVRDVDLTEQVYLALNKRMTQLGYSELSAEIEHTTRKIVDEQQAHGFFFERSRGEDLLKFLRQRQADLAEPIQKLFPPKLEEMGRHTRRRRKDGTDFASYLRHLETYPKVVHNEDGTYSCFDWKIFNIGSPLQRLERLLELGFTTTAKTKKGRPQVDEESLLKFAETSGREEVRAMAEWLVCSGRANMVENWLGYVGLDSRIHGKVLTCGATTRRMTHSGPNTANIPSGAKAQYGHECRSLWSVEPLKGLKLVGVDASGLETIGLLHYLGNKQAEAVLTRPKPDDVHSMNSRALTKVLGREIDREWGAKTSWYAWLFGAYPPKIGSIVKGPASDGDLVIQTFFKNVPGLKGLIESVQSEWYDNDGLLRTVDGGFVRCPSVNAALNYKVQSLGAIVMKLAAMILYKNSDFVWYTVGTIHDEWQLETKAENAERLGRLAVMTITQAAEQLNFKLPLTGDFKIGDSWNQTH